ncbi:MAG: hypothetical protein PF503_10255 [Desulfobacula sp.]|jgi:uncharacterized Zn finger protein|nr:hypothetical protein [Desulfobacula sp.]
MSRYRYSFPKYVSVEEKRAKAEKKIKQLKKKKSDISPIQILGRTLADSWWGISWNKNLEGYADFSNRIGRGRSYVRHGAVLDLKITEGKILSLVQGSSLYKVEISIRKLKFSVWKTIIQECQGKIDSLGALIDGKLPKVMETLLTNPENGIFPSPSDIDFDCSCPDWALMCKHVAATLYGVGTRLDQDPSLFFTLRGVNMEDLVSQAVKKEADELLKRAKSKTSRRIIKDADLSSAFGIDMEDLPSPSTPIVKKTPKSGKKAAKKVAKTVVPEVKSKKLPIKKESDYDVVVGIIRRRRVKGIGLKEIKDRTGIEDARIRNIIFRANKKNKIQNISRGLYIKGEKE